MPVRATGRPDYKTDRLCCVREVYLEGVRAISAAWRPSFVIATTLRVQPGISGDTEKQQRSRGRSSELLHPRQLFRLQST